MFKKCYILMTIVLALLVFSGCAKKTSNDAVTELPPWVGQYVMTNEETEEFKILTIESATETEVVYSFESVRGTDEFTGILKTKSKKYAVCNAGDRCLKFDLKSSSTVVAVDDIWTSENERNENWSGRYKRLEEGEVIESFGDSSWNGKYTCAESGLSVELYGIKEGLVLLSYQDAATGEKQEFKCIISAENDKLAVFTDETRTIELNLSGKTVDITDTPVDETLPTITGRYLA